MPESIDPGKGQRHFADVLRAIKNPLVLFGLVLLVIEAMLSFVMLNSKMTGTQQFVMGLAMVVITLAVVAAVAYITIKHPKNWYKSLLERLEDTESAQDNIQDMIETEGLRDVIIDVVTEDIVEVLNDVEALEERIDALAKRIESHDAS